MYWYAVLNLFKGLYRNARIVAIPVKAGVQMAASMVVGNFDKVKAILDGSANSGGSGSASKRYRDSNSGNRTSSDYSKSNLGGAKFRFKKVFKRRGRAIEPSDASKRANRVAEETLKDVFSEQPTTQSKFDALDKEMKKSED